MKTTPQGASSSWAHAATPPPLPSLPSIYLASLPLTLQYPSFPSDLPLPTYFPVPFPGALPLNPAMGLGERCKLPQRGPRLRSFSVMISRIRCRWSGPLCRRSLVRRQSWSCMKWTEIPASSRWTFVSIGVGDGGRGTHAPPKNIFWAIIM